MPCGTRGYTKPLPEQTPRLRNATLWHISEDRARKLPSGEILRPTPLSQRRYAGSSVYTGNHVYHTRVPALPRLSIPSAVISPGL